MTPNSRHASFNANTDYDQIMFRGELEELRREFPGRLECQHHLDSQSGLADAVTIASFAGRDIECDYFICGPAAFMDLTEEVLEGLGVDARHVFIERFTVTDEPDTQVGEEDVLAAESYVATFRATLDGEEHEVPYVAGETLLDCMLNQGLDPVHSCKDAHCGSCMVIRRERQCRDAQEYRAVEARQGKRLHPPMPGRAAIG